MQDHAHGDQNLNLGNTGTFPPSSGLSFSLPFPLARFPCSYFHITSICHLSLLVFPSSTPQHKDPSASHLLERHPSKCWSWSGNRDRESKGRRHAWPVTTVQQDLSPTRELWTWCRTWVRVNPPKGRGSCRIPPLNCNQSLVGTAPWALTLWDSGSQIEAPRWKVPGPRCSGHSSGALTHADAAAIMAAPLPRPNAL